MKYTLKYLVLSLLVGCLSSCASNRVNTDQMPSANLSQYRTFRFADAQVRTSNPLYSGSLIDQRIHANVATELAKRGMVEDTAQADMVVIYHTYTEQKQSSINNYYPMMYGGWGWRFYPWSYQLYPYGLNGFNRTYTYTEGTLILDLADARTKQVVWRGSITDVVDGMKNLDKKIDKAIVSIFKKYPIPEDKNFDDRTKTVAKSTNTK